MLEKSWGVASHGLKPTRKSRRATLSAHKPDRLRSIPASGKCWLSYHPEQKLTRLQQLLFNRWLWNNSDFPKPATHMQYNWVMYAMLKLECLSANWSIWVNIYHLDYTIFFFPKTCNLTNCETSFKVKFQGKFRYQQQKHSFSRIAKGSAQKCNTTCYFHKILEWFF